MQRTIEKKLIKWASKKGRKPLILSGARQIGKTYVLQKFGEANFPKVHYFNFERKPELLKFFDKDLVPSRIINDLCIEFGIEIDVNNDFVIFDEIQACPKALTSLKYFCEDMPELCLAAAGSLLGVHLGESSYPVGKVDLLNMYPMSFEEFLLAVEGDGLRYKEFQKLNSKYESSSSLHSILWQLLKIYFIVGGLPEAVLAYMEYKDSPFEAFRNVRMVQERLITMYKSDIAKHSGKVNSMHIERVWSNVPAQLSSEHDGSTNKYKFKDVVPGMNKYSRLVNSIDWLLATGLIIKVSMIEEAKMPLKAYTKENRFKLFIFDVGILGALNNLEPKSILDYDYGTYKGYFAENFVAQEFTYAAESILFQLFCWKRNTSEIEFVTQVETDIIPIEVKSGERTNSKSLNVFNDIYKPPCRVKMSAKPLNFDEQNKVYNYPLYLAYKFPKL